MSLVRTGTQTTSPSRELHVLKERDTGKLCYQAEEDLPQADLSLLKDMLSMEKSKWETYKQKCRESLRK